MEQGKMIGASGANAVLSLRDASVRFGQGKTVGPFSGDFFAGDFVVVTGESGSGKTTFLRLCAGLLTAAGGSVDRSAGLVTGYVFQEPRLLPWCRVSENVMLPMLAAGVDAAEARARTEGLLDEAGLKDSAAQWPLTLSGGMAQRVNLIRALGIGPKLLLLDEPFSSLDAAGRSKMLDLVARHGRDAGMTVICVTHYPEELSGFTTRSMALGADGAAI